MRRFIIASNKPNLAIDTAKVYLMNQSDLEIMFNRDCLNVLNQSEYDAQLELEYLYGVEIEFDNYLTGYRKFLKALIEFDQNLLVIYDVSIKRYINHHELAYFANNKLLPSKLFNIEITSDENQTVYTTIGLASIGLKEFKFMTNLYLNEEDFQIFKAVVTNYIIGKKAKININTSYIDYLIIDDGDFIKFSYIRPNRIYEFFIRDDLYLDKIRYQLIKYHWPVYLELQRNFPELGNYVINKSKVHDYENFDVHHVEEFTIICEGINYNQDNLFYGYKYL